MGTAEQWEKEARGRLVGKALEDHRALSVVSQILELRGFLPRPQGIFRKRCPACRSRLTTWRGHDEAYYYTLLRCANCSYRYATRDYLVQEGD